MEALGRLDAIPGVARQTAEILVAEIGVNMSRFPSTAHLASWAAMCPGNNESTGKRKSGRTRRGSPWLGAALVEAARAAQGTKGTYLGAQYRRLKARQGGKRAAVAVGHSILIGADHILGGLQASSISASITGSKPPAAANTAWLSVSAGSVTPSSSPQL